MCFGGAFSRVVHLSGISSNLGRGECGYTAPRMRSGAEGEMGLGQGWECEVVKVRSDLNFSPSTICRSK
jgi:hypothetical protein